MNLPDPLTDIEKYFGKEKADYVKNKNKGGCNNAKGTKYEEHYAIYQLAKLAPHVLEKEDKIHILSQVKEFVDDLQLEYPQKNYKLDFQLKDSTQVSWDKGKHPIAIDFDDQQKLNNYRGKGSKQYLVVSDAALAEKLRHSRPANIKLFSCVVEYFSGEKSINVRLLAEEDFRSAIAYLCSYPEELDKLVYVAGLLLAAWNEAVTQPESNITTILKFARKHNPSYIRVFEPVTPLLEEVKKILNKIPDFIYDIQRGFFKWEYLDGLETGQFSYDCNDTKFYKFQKLILREKPACFDELEGLLL